MKVPDQSSHEKSRIQVESGIGVTEVHLESQAEVPILVKLCKKYELYTCVAGRGYSSDVH